MLQPIDIVVALKLVLLAGEAYSFEKLEQQTGISSSSIHRSVKRLEAARLVLDARRVQIRALEELIIYGVRYVYYTQQCVPTRGFPTAWAAAPLNLDIVSSDLPPVWPDPEGTVRGYAVAPLHKAVPRAAMQDDRLYQLLALVDAIRIGAARERILAGQFIREAFKSSSARQLTALT